MCVCFAIFIFFNSLINQIVSAVPQYKLCVNCISPQWPKIRCRGDYTKFLLSSGVHKRSKDLMFIHLSEYGQNFSFYFTNVHTSVFPLSFLLLGQFEDICSKLAKWLGQFNKFLMFFLYFFKISWDKLANFWASSTCCCKETPSTTGWNHYIFYPHYTGIRKGFFFLQICTHFIQMYVVSNTHTKQIALSVDGVYCMTELFCKQLSNEVLVKIIPILSSRWWRFVTATSPIARHMALAGTLICIHLFDSFMRLWLFLGWFWYYNNFSWFAKIWPSTKFGDFY